jgi:nucleoside-diphosphate-sugar epimerase
MRVFVTGASGFIGSAIVRELLGAGHEVLGLARSDQAASAVGAAGATVHRGDISDLDSLTRGAAESDGVVHTAFNHDFSVSRVDAAAADRRAVEAMAKALVGTGRPIVIASGTAGLSPGSLATEETVPKADAIGRYAVEEAVISFASRGVRPAVVRFPPTVHGVGDHGFVARLIDIARERGVSGYPGDGSNRWPAVHRLDAARLFCLAVESAPAGARLHGVGEEGIPVREIAEVIGRRLGLPVVAIPPTETDAHFGFLGAFFSLDCPASSVLTQRLLEWQPVQAGLIADLEQGHYFERSPARAAR